MKRFTKNQRMPHPLAVGMNLSSRWGFQRGRSTPLVKGGVNAPPAKARRAARVLRCRRVYFTSEDGEIFVVKAGPKYELLATNNMGEVCMATPAISDGTFFIRAQRHLYAIAEPSAAAKPASGK